MGYCAMEKYFGVVVGKRLSLIEMENIVRLRKETTAQYSRSNTDHAHKRRKRKTNSFQ